MKIKFCGLRSTRDIEYINEAGADFAGFIFAPQSKRRVAAETAKEMKNALNSGIKSVGVFVNAETDEIKRLYEANIIDFIQLHGNETNEYIKELKKFADGKIIKAYAGCADLKDEISKSLADFCLLDTKCAEGFGGTGKTFDYGYVPKGIKNIFLAGGINSQNVINAIKTVNPYCIDINSGVETDGTKDRKKILEITRIIRDFEKEQEGKTNE